MHFPAQSRVLVSNIGLRKITVRAFGYGVEQYVVKATIASDTACDTIRSEL